MIKRGKQYKAAREAIDKTQALSLVKGIEEVKKLSFAKFDESFDVDVCLGIDPSKGDQVVRGSVALPHGTGRKTRVLVFAKGDYATQAQKAGADYVGAEDLIEKV